MTLENHIHLDTTLGGSPEFSPVLKWKTTDRLDIPEIQVAIERGLTGKLHTGVLTNASGPVQFQNFRYTIRVQADDTYTVAERAALLKGLNGKLVYFVDVFHCADGAAHTSYVRTMFLQVGEFPMTHGPGFPYFLVDVDLIDADTVS